MKFNNNRYALFSLITLFFVSLPLHAAWYQVEVIVFAYLSPDSDGELWYENPGLPERSNSIELITQLADNDADIKGVLAAENENEAALKNREERMPYLQLSPDQFHLDGVQRVLKLSHEYRPLMHVAWQQPGLITANARAVHLQKVVEDDESDTNELPSRVADRSTALSKEQEGSISTRPVQDPVVDGTIRLRSSKFLHVDVDIAYFPWFFSSQNNTNVEDGSPFVPQQADYVRLQESRKIRLNEIQYFDHPLFGVILRVSRLKLK